MSDKKTEKEINEVLLNYVKSNNPVVLKMTGISVGFLIAAGIGIDLMMTGGLFSFGTWVVGGLASLLGIYTVSRLAVGNTERTRTNTAAQTLECNALVNSTLKEMESRLQNAFRKTQDSFRRELLIPKEDDENEFKKLAAEIEQDVKKLSPAFKIVAGGPHSFSTDKYEFILDKEKRITLSQALQPPSP